MDLKEVLGWDAENLDQRILNRLRHFPETGVVILTFEHVDFCERQVLVSLSKATPRRRGCPQHRPPRWARNCTVPFEHVARRMGVRLERSDLGNPRSAKISLPVMKRL